jgi:hypothetical protein
MSFLNDTQEFSALIFAELNVEMLPLDLQFFRLDDVIHFFLQPPTLRSRFVEGKKNPLPFVKSESHRNSPEANEVSHESLRGNRRHPFHFHRVIDLEGQRRPAAVYLFGGEPVHLAAPDRWPETKYSFVPPGTRRIAERFPGAKALAYFIFLTVGGRMFCP